MVAAFIGFCVELLFMRYQQVLCFYLCVQFPEGEKYSFHYNYLIEVAVAEYSPKNLTLYFYFDQGSLKPAKPVTYLYLCADKYAW